MDATTIRHMIVFGVCALGVGGLYLVPSAANPPPVVSIRQAAEDPVPRPSTSPGVRVPQSGATGEASQPDVDARKAEASQSAAVQPQPTEQRNQSSPSPTAAGRTAYDPQDAPDSEPPSVVGTITPTEVTADTLSIAWPAATDNRRVIGYRILLNGYEVATTAETQVKLHWFNDEEGQHLVQVKAIDAAGNQSPTWATLLVTRPSAGPTVSQTPAPTSPPPDPTSTPSPSVSQSIEPGTDPTAPGTGSPTNPAPEPTPR